MGAIISTTILFTRLMSTRVDYSMGREWLQTFSARLLILDYISKRLFRLHKPGIPQNHRYNADDQRESEVAP